jgi:hypothetical protein
MMTAKDFNSIIGATVITGIVSVIVFNVLVFLYISTQDLYDYIVEAFKKYYTETGIAMEFTNIEIFFYGSGIIFCVLGFIALMYYAD